MGPSHVPASPPALRRALQVFCGVGIAAFIVDEAFSVGEALRAGAGLTALWLPFGGLIYVLARDSFEDATSRLTFGAIASYALTTAAFFVASAGDRWVPGSAAAFYGLQVAALVAFLLVGFRRGLWSAAALRAAAGRIDWALVLLVAASVLANGKYRVAFEEVGGGRRVLAADGDQTYYAAIVHELGRGTPPRQQAIRAGVPERAYHIFPHVTTLLVARYAGQGDVLRAHLAYEYAAIDALVVLAVFCVARSLSGRAFPAYLSAACVSVAAVPLPPLFGDTDPPESVFFYFALWPQASSGLEPTLITSPQMYSGLLVYFGTLLGVAECVRGLRAGAPGRVAFAVTALMAASLLRFRVQVFLPVLPAWLTMLAVLARTHRRPSLLLYGAVTLAAAAVLAAEMRSPDYLPNTASLRFGNADIWRLPLLQSWPGFAQVRGVAKELLAEGTPAFEWVMQIACVGAFSALNVVGLVPLALVACHLCRSRALPGTRLIDGFVVLTAVCSLAGACFLVAPYDSWSVGGQMVLHLGWYALPFLGPGLCAAARSLPFLGRAPPAAAPAVAAAFLAACFAWQLVRPPTPLALRTLERRIEIDGDEWESWERVRTTFAPDAVLASSTLHGPHIAVGAGLGGRRAFLDYVPSPVKAWADDADSDVRRIEAIRAVWSAPSEAALRAALPPVVTHLVEFENRPLRVRPPGLLERVWRSTRGRVVIWEVRR